MGEAHDLLLVIGMRDMEGWREIKGKKGGRGMKEEERNLERRNWICLNVESLPFLAIELKVNQILSCFNLQGQRVVRLVTLEFGEYALDIRSRVIEPCESWKDLKHLMRKRLFQGSKNVKEYHKEMEMDLMRAQIRESVEATLAQFLHGLNREI
ncbi:hypothetical protein CR513_42404, partial [Mucuna pruriens]